MDHLPITTRYLRPKENCIVYFCVQTENLWRTHAYEAEKVFVQARPVLPSTNIKYITIP